MIKKDTGLADDREDSAKSLGIATDEKAVPLKPILAVVAGSGQVAKNAVEAGADVLLALNAGVYRNLGHGSLASFLPFGNANRQTRELLKQHILPAARSAKVVAGVDISLYHRANDWWPLVCPCQVPVWRRVLSPRRAH